MHRHKHLFEQVVSFENVLAAAREALRGKRWREPGASFYADLERQVVDLHPPERRPHKRAGHLCQDRLAMYELLKRTPVYGKAG